MKGKYLKKALAIVLTTAMTVTALAGCGGGNGSTSGNTANKTTSAAGDTTAADDGGSAENAGADKTGSDVGGSSSGADLVFWNVAYKTVDDTGKLSTDELILNKTIAEFEEKHNVKVEVVNQTYDNIVQLFKTAGLAKNGPDVAFMWTGAYTNDYKTFIEPLDSYFTDEELSQFPNLDLCRVDFSSEGDLLGIPTDMTTLNLYYNKDAFKAAGIPEDIQFKTFDELLDACQKLSDAGITPFAMTDANGYTSAWVMGEMLSHKLGPDDIFKLRTGEETMDGTTAVESMNEWVGFCQKLIENGWVNEDAFTTATDDVFMEIFSGDSAMRFGGSWDAQGLYDELGDRVGTMRIPVFSTDEPFADHITAQFSNNLVVTNYSKNKELAVELIKAFSTPEFHLARYEQDQQLPARLDVDMTAAAVSNPLSNASYSWIQEDKNVVGFDSVISADSAAEFYRLAPIMITGGANVDESMKTVQSKNVTVAN